MAGLMLGLGGEGLGAGLLAGGPRPSYFELFAQEWLMAGLRPAMRSRVMFPVYRSTLPSYSPTAMLLRSSDAATAETGTGRFRVTLMVRISCGAPPRSTLS